MFLSRIINMHLDRLHTCMAGALVSVISQAMQPTAVVN